MHWRMNFEERLNKLEGKETIGHNSSQVGRDTWYLSHLKQLTKLRKLQ